MNIFSHQKMDLEDIKVWHVVVVIVALIILYYLYSKSSSSTTTATSTSSFSLFPTKARPMVKKAKCCG